MPCFSKVHHSSTRLQSLKFELRRESRIFVDHGLREISDRVFRSLSALNFRTILMKFGLEHCKSLLEEFLINCNAFFGPSIGHRTQCSVDNADK